jgi:enoyl-CoA hydratase/carnithine racemase
MTAGPAGTVEIERDGAIAIVRLNRPAKRNALDDPTIETLQAFFAHPPEGVRAAVLCGAGEHFCAGLDLAELKARSAAEGLAHSRMWHRAFEEIQFGDVPVVAVVHGAVVGGGLELACAAHIRVAETTAFYALPEGSRGLFVGGGGSARIPHLIGIARMTDMMLTGRVYGAEEGQQIGFSTYLVAPGEGLAKALELARRIAANAPLTNFAVMHALPRIAEAGQDHGLFTESLMAAVAQSEPEAKARLDAFLAGRAAKVDKADR